MKELEHTQNERVKCPVCGGAFSVRSYHPEKSGFWQHYFGKRCRALRTQSSATYPNSTEIAMLIKQADNRNQKRQDAAMKRQKEAEAAEKRELHDQVYRKHVVTGGFLLDIVGELSGALDMMEPYYSQCDADETGRDMISRIGDIIDQDSVQENQ